MRDTLLGMLFAGIGGGTCEVRYDAANPDDPLWTGERLSTA